MRAAGPVDVVSHDWWTYLLVSGAGGIVIYDSEPSISYRQHGGNLIGSNMKLVNRLQRLRMLIKNRRKQWSNRNISALRQSWVLLSPENRSILDEFCRAREANFLSRLWGIRRSGVYAQTLAGNVGLFVATFLKKI
jgi:hypothetical protein